jgi:hypothetical protein
MKPVLVTVTAPERMATASLLPLASAVIDPMLFIDALSPVSMALATLEPLVVAVMEPELLTLTAP